MSTHKLIQAIPPVPASRWPNTFATFTPCSKKFFNLSRVWVASRCFHGEIGRLDTSRRAAPFPGNTDPRESSPTFWKKQSGYDVAALVPRLNRPGNFFSRRTKPLRTVPRRDGCRTRAGTRQVRRFGDCRLCYAPLERTPACFLSSLSAETMAASIRSIEKIHRKSWTQWSVRVGITRRLPRNLRLFCVVGLWCKMSGVFVRLFRYYSSCFILLAWLLSKLVVLRSVSFLQMYY